MAEVLLGALAGFRSGADALRVAVIALFASDPQHTGLHELRETAVTGVDLGGSAVPTL